MSWVYGVDYLDSLVKEYLKFRSLNNSLKALDTDLKADKDKLSKVDKTVQRLLHFIHTYDCDGLTSHWGHLNQEYFCRFGRDHEALIEKFEANLHRLYMVHAIQNSRNKELQTFLQKITTDFKNTSELKEWHAVAFTQAADSKSALAPYFTRQWSETFLVSLHNLLASLFSCMPEPDLVRACIDDGKRISELEKENENLSAKLTDTVSRNHTSALGFDVAYVKALGMPSSLKRNLALSDLPNLDGKSSSGIKSVSSKDSPNGSEISKSAWKHLSDPAKENDVDVKSMLEPEIMTSDKKAAMNDISGVGVASSVVSTIEELPHTQLNSTSSGHHLKKDNVTVHDGLYPDNIIKPQVKVEQHRILEATDISYEKSVDLRQQQDMLTAVAMSSESPDSIGEFSLDFISDSPKSSAKEPEHSVGLPLGSSIPWSRYQTGSSLLSTNNPFLILSRGIFHGHHSTVVQCKFDNSGTVVGSVDGEGIVKVWQTEPRITSVCTLIPSVVKCLEWCSRPADVILLGTSSGTIRLFDTLKKTSLEDVQVDEHSQITNIRTHPTDASFATSSIKSCDVKHHSTGSVGQVTIWDIHASHVRLNQNLVGANCCPVTCMDYNHNGNLLVTGDSFGHISLYDTKTYSIIHSRQAHDGTVCSVQFSSDETLVFSLGSDSELMAWSVNHLPSHLSKFHFGDSTTSSVSKANLPKFILSPEGNHVLVSAGIKGLIYEINTTDHTMGVALSLPEQKSPLTALDWIANNACSHCLTGSSDGKIQVTTLMEQ